MEDEQNNKKQINKKKWILWDKKVKTIKLSGSWLEDTDLSLFYRTPISKVKNVLSYSRPKL